jgi:hypothetical protein
MVERHVQFMWMYSKERELKKLRATLRIKAMVEGCITEAFTCKKITNFSSMYVKVCEGFDCLPLIIVSS